MRNMFYAASRFNQNIGDWDTSALADGTAFHWMFMQADAFEYDLAEWCGTPAGSPIIACP